MVVIIEYFYYNPLIGTICDIMKNAKHEHGEKNGFIERYKADVKTIIEFIDQLNKKTKKCYD